MLKELFENYLVYGTLGLGILGLLFSFLLYIFSFRKYEGTDKMKEFSKNIKKGVFSFLKKEYLIIAIIIVVLGVPLFLFGGLKITIAFVIGAVITMLVGVLSILSATKANLKTVYMAESKGQEQAFGSAFSGAAVIGLLVAGLGLVAVSGFYLFYILKGSNDGTMDIVGFALGAAIVALFARIGGSIYTKTSDMSADVIGKVEKGISEDDSRNPATLADNVGDYVGDMIGMGTDIFESYVGAIIATMLIASTVLFYRSDINELIALPLVLAGVGIVSSILGIASMYLFSKTAAPQAALRYSVLFGSVVFLALSYAVVSYIGISSYFTMGTFWALVSGVLAVIATGLLIEYYTSSAPIKSLAKISENGPTQNIIAGLALGMESVFWPTVVICIAIFASYLTAGVFGIGILALGMLATVGISMSVDAYGPIADTAGGISQVSGTEEDTKKITESLDCIGNTTSAMGRGFSLGSAVLTSIAFLISYLALSGSSQIDFSKPVTAFGMLLGCSFPFVISAISLKAVSRSSLAMTKEINSQFDANPKILSGESEPDFVSCTKLSSRSAIKSMLFPGILAVLFPILLSVIFGAYSLGGFLIGIIVSGFALGLFMVNTGGALDNAKKFIEKGFFGGKGSKAHTASIIGDSAGDSMKDVVGPTISILIKTTCLVSLVLLIIL